MEDGTKICTECGEDLQKPEECPAEETVLTEETAPVAEETAPVAEEAAPAQVKTVYVEVPQTKVNVWMYVAITACCALGVLLGFLIWQGMRPDTGTETTAPTVNQFETPSTDAASDIPTAEELGITIEGFMDRAAYCVDDETAAANADEAVVTFGDYKLTNSQLQVYYRNCYVGFVTEVTDGGGDVLTDYGLDISKPLNEQYVLESEVSWEQYFLHEAIVTWKQYACVNAMADIEDYQLDDEYLQAIEEEMASLEEQAVTDGFADGEALVKERMGVNCSVADYREYIEFTTRANAYSKYFDSNYVPTEEDVNEFYELNIDYYTYYGITKEAGKGVSVRHILLQPGEVDTSTGLPNATDEQWEECRVETEELYAQWQAGQATEESFAELAKEHSTDGGSATNGGLYEDVLSGQMVENFDAWLFDASRKPGDTGIVKTEYGYHIMYYVALSEQDAWYTTAYNDAISYSYGFNEAFGVKMEELVMTTALDKIAVLDLAQETTQQDAADTTDPTSAE